MLNYLFSLVTLFSFTARSQDFSIIWDNTLGGDHVEIASKLIKTSDGNFICAGSSFSNASGDKSEDSRGTLDYWIVKVTPEGEVLWDVTYGGDGWDYLYDGIETQDHNLVFVGGSQSNTSGDKSEDCMGLSDIWLIKLDDSGNLLWENTIGGDSGDMGVEVIETPGTDLIVVAGSESGISGDKTEASKGGYDFWIVRVNSTGEFLEDQVIGGSENDHPSAVLFNSDGSMLVYGASFSGVSGDKTEGNRGGSDIWLVKLNESGDVLWDKTYGGSEDDSDVSFHMERTSGGGYIVVSTSYSPADGDKIDFRRGESDFWVLRLDSEGEILWQKTIGGNHLDHATKIVRLEDGGFLIAGYTLSGVSFEKSEALKGDGWNDGWLIRLDESGDILWDHGIGGAGSDALNDLVEFNDAFYLLSNSLSEAGFDKTENPVGDMGYEDYWMLKIVLCEDLTNEVVFEDGVLMAVQNEATYQWLDCDADFAPIDGETGQYFTPPGEGNYAVRITEGDCETVSTCFSVGSIGYIESSAESLHFYPNPVNEIVFISKAPNTSIVISSVDGQQIIRSNANKIDVRDLDKGVYLIDLIDEKGTIITTGKMVKN